MRFNVLPNVVVVTLLLLSTGDVIDLIAAGSIEVQVTGLGDIHGTTHSSSDGTHADEFLGIPYAEPPVGDLRFRAPKPFKPLNNWKFNATVLPKTCHQVPDDTFDKVYVDMWNPNTEMSEDCLYLNIWRPSGIQSTDPKRAVMVWIYGGGFSSGTSTLNLYDGKYLASHGDVIVVSMQYRVGPLGFLALCKKSGVAGNAGLLDQQTALKWVHEHIASFGGDPERITLFGESAGAASVSYHLLSGGSKQFFTSAILESAAVGGSWTFIEWDDAVEKALELAEKVKCKSGSHEKIVSCLREVSADLLTSVQFNVTMDGPSITSTFHPTVDGEFIVKDPEDIIEDKNFHDKSILLGTNKDEGSYFMLYLFQDIFFNATQKEAHQISQNVFAKLVREMKLVDDDDDDHDDDDDDDDGKDKKGKDKDSHRNDDKDDDDDDDDLVENVVLFEYGTPCSDEGSDTFSYTDALEDLIGDALFKCPVVRFAKAYAEKNQSVYLYTFNHRTSGNPWPAWTGAAHGFEIDHVFGVPSQAKHKSTYSDEERTLSNQIITYWTNFAKTGDPNTGGNNKVAVIQWPKYTPKTRSVMVLDTKQLKVKTGLRERQCNFWNNLVPLLEEVDSGSAGCYSGHMGNLWTLLCISLAVVMRSRT